MKQIKLKVTYIQIFFLLSIFVTFLPNGLIYASGKAAQIVRVMYLVQFFIYSVTIFLCAKKSLRLIKAPVIGFMVWGIILLLVTINYTKDLMKVFRAAVYLLGILTIFLIVSYMFSYQSEKVFLMIYRYLPFFLFSIWQRLFWHQTDCFLMDGKEQRIGLAENSLRSICIIYGCACIQ